MRYVILATAALGILAVRCAPAAPADAAAATAATTYADALIRDVPHVRQRPDFCGEACAAMALAHLGKKWDQNDVFDISGVDPREARGCRTAELAVALRRIGVNTGANWYHVATARADAEMEAQWAALHADLARGIASIVCMHYDDSADAPEHFRLVLGYDAKTDEVLYHEPARDAGALLRMKRSVFLRLWPLRYQRDTWTLVRLRLAPGNVRNPPPREGAHDAADFAQHMMTLKKKIPAQGFHVVLAPPFVVIGDEPEAAVQHHARNEIRWAIARLKADYFAKDPPEILDIWLFRDKQSYEKHTKAIFNENPGTPFGYYSSAHGALIMNIETGGGTLIHELVHPFMAANFPDCPPWLNEGMGSLYEQCSDRGGHIVGLTNWRLPGLQKAIRAGAVPPFETLMAMSSRQFYNADKGTNYAQARYLCYWLQQRGLLVRYFHDFLAARKDDPTGHKTLQKVLGETDMAAFQKRWEAFVLKLTFP